MSIAIIPLFLFLLLIVALPIIIGIYVYKDASFRGMNAVLWTLLAVLAPGFVGLIIYLIARPGNSDARCHKCNGSVRENFVVCPHCGTPIPEEQKTKMATTARSDKGLGRLLLLLIIVPISLCILLLLAVTFFGFSKSSSHSSYIDANGIEKEYNE